MKRRRIGWRYGWLIVTVGLAAGARVEAAPLLRHTFEQSADGWTGFGTNNKAAVTREAAHVKEGKAALKYDYPVEKGEMGMLHLPVSDGALAKAKSVRFWVKADHTTALTVTLQEKQGGRYDAAFSAPKDQWQQVELALSDFFLAEGKDDPKDPNDRLDLDQVDGVRIADLAQFFVQIEDATLRELLGAHPGARTFYLDDLTISDEALPEATPETGGRVRLDRFNRPQLHWIGIGDVLLAPAPMPPGAAGRTEGGLKADYAQGPGKLAGFVRSIPRGALKGMERLLFDAASERPLQLIVQVEEAGGGKYNTTVSIPGGSKVQTLSLPFSQFSEGMDSNDDNNRLDLDQVNRLVILDLSGFTGADEGDNTLRIGNLLAAPAMGGQ